MKKFNYISSIILLFCFINTSFGFIDQRYQYWQIQLKNIQDEKNKLSESKNFDSSIAKLISSDIKRAESILKFIENFLDTEPTGFEKKKYNQTDLKIEIQKILTPVFSLKYLEFILNNIGSQESFKLAEKKVSELIDSEIYRNFNQKDNLLRDKLLKEKFTKNDWKYLAAELWLGSMMSKDRIFDILSLKVEKKISQILSKSDFYISQNDLKNLIDTASNESIMQADFSVLLGSENPLTSSWCWKEKNADIIGELNKLNDIILLFQKTGVGYQLLQVYSSVNNIRDLEEFYFTTLKDKLSDDIRELMEKKNNKTSNLPAVDNPYFLNIPDLPELALIIDNIDKARTGYEKSANNNDPGNSIGNIEDKFSNIIITAFSKTKSKFIDEENLLNDLSEQYMDNSGNRYFKDENKNNSDNRTNDIKLIPINKTEFDRAKIIYEKQVEMAYDYADLNIKFLKLIYKTNSKKQSGNFSKRFEINMKYIRGMEKLALNCSEYDTLTAPAFYKQYHSIIVRISNLFKFIAYSFNPKTDTLKNLNDNELYEIRLQKETVKNEIGNSLNKIKNVYVAKIKSAEEKRKKLKALKNEIKDELAEIELRNLTISLNEYLSAYEKFKYSGQALKNYAEKYDEILDSAKSGTMNKSLDQAVRFQSIIPLVDNFSAEKIKHEFAARNYLKNIIYKRLSSINTLVNFYKHKGIKVTNNPDNLIKSANEKLRTRYDIPVAGWIMTESNFDNIDKKAVQKLQFIIKRRIWDPEKNNGKVVLNNINIDDFKISLNIPDGWKEQEVNSLESENGIIKSFKSVDGTSAIYIAAYDFSDNVKDASEYWINEMNSRRVAQKWGEKDAADYYWTLSNHDKGVMESYAISYNHRVLILSGIASKDKYNFFKKKITGVFQSITSI